MSKKARVEYFMDAAGEHRWRVWAANGKIVGESGEGYKRPSGARDGFTALLSTMTEIQTERDVSEPAPAKKPRKPRAKKSAPADTTPASGDLPLGEPDPFREFIDHVEGR